MDFCGQLYGEIQYYDNDYIPQTESLGDIVQKMYEYAGFNYASAYPAQTTSYSNKGMCIGNPEFMFRQNHDDRFEIQV